MKKVLVIIGVVILLVGVILFAAGYTMHADPSEKIDECNSTEGQIKRLTDPAYQTECEEAVDTANMYTAICMAGIPMLIVGIIILIAGLVMKPKAQPGQYPPGQFQQPYPQQPYQQPPPQPGYPPQQPYQQPYQQPPPQYQQPPPQQPPY